MWLANSYQRPCRGALLPWTEISLALTLWPRLHPFNPPWHITSLPPPPHFPLILWEVSTHLQPASTPEPHKRLFFSWYFTTATMTNLLHLQSCVRFMASFVNIYRRLELPLVALWKFRFALTERRCGVVWLPMWPVMQGWSVGYVTGFRDVAAVMVLFVLSISVKPNVSLSRFSPLAPDPTPLFLLVFPSSSAPCSHSQPLC